MQSHRLALPIFGCLQLPTQLKLILQIMPSYLDSMSGSQEIKTPQVASSGDQQLHNSVIEATKENHISEVMTNPLHANDAIIPDLTYFDQWYQVEGGKSDVY